MTLLAFELLPHSIELFLQIDDEKIYKSITSEMRQSEVLLHEIHQFLTENNCSLRKIDCIACNRGPGSFTALRIALSTAKGLSLGKNIPLVSVCGFDGFQFISQERKEILLPILDGRKNRFYGALYENGQRISDYVDLKAEDLINLPPKEKEVLIYGEDAPTFKEALKGVLPPHWSIAEKLNEPLIAFWSRLAIKKYANGQFDSPAQGPFYIRKSQAEEGS